MVLKHAMLNPGPHVQHVGLECTSILQHSGSIDAHSFSSGVPTPALSETTL